jgi:hypothetical protein
MALDPREAVRRSGQSGEADLRAQIAELRKAVEDLQRSRDVMVTTGAPAIAAPAGALAVDIAAHRLYVSEGGGAWKSTVIA